MTYIDPEIPAEVQEQMDIKKMLLSGDYEDVEEGDNDEVYVDHIPDGAPANFDDVKQIIQQGAPKKRYYKATLRHELYTISFSVEDISIADYQLALKIPRNDFRFEPTPHSKFILEVRNKKYPIVYVGGLFDFPSDATWALTFILDYDSSSSDKSE